MSQLSMLQRFARMLRVRDDQAEDALGSERVARHVMTRRSFFGAAAALASSKAFSFGGLESADQYEFRLVSYPMLAMNAPAVAFMNPVDYAMLEAALVGTAVVPDRHVPRNSIFMLGAQGAEPFRGVEREPPQKKPRRWWEAM